MAEYEVELGMPADAEIVFDVASDLDRLDSWLPAEVTGEGPNRVHVAGELDGRQVDETGLIDVRKEHLRLEWGSESDADYAGWLQVSHAGSGASSATLHLSFFGGQPENRGHQQGVEKEIEAALRRLADQVTARVDGSNG
jgi:uncharacterized protein YndB with AHSA1/START domain